jgi:hypothetical protein
LNIAPITGIQNPIASSLIDAFGRALLYSLIFGFFLFYIQTRLDESDQKHQKRVAEVREELDKAKIEERNLVEKQEKLGEETTRTVDDLRKEINEVRKADARIRILQGARLGDYSKELDFWRDTIRKVLYQSSSDEKISEMLIRQVTESLKTYGTLESSKDYDAIAAMAKLLTDSSRLQVDKSKDT